MTRPLLTREAHNSYLPGAYDVGKKVLELLQQWKVAVPGDVRKPEFATQGTDYGFDQDAFACEVSLNRAAGKSIKQRIVSVLPFDANGLGQWAALDAKSLVDGTGHLYVLNSAPGRNVRQGTTDNVREGFFGAKLKNGAIVVGTISEDLPSYFLDQAETMVELPLQKAGERERTKTGLSRWKAKSQARGVDVFQTLATAFYHEASQPSWRGGRHEIITDIVPRTPQPGTQLVMNRPARPAADGIPRYVLSSHSKFQASLPNTHSHIPVPSNDLRAAGYSAFRLGNGGQPQRDIADVGNVPAIYVLEVGLNGLSDDEQVAMWAQIQNDGSLVVGPANRELWGFSPAERPIFKLDRTSSRRDVLQFADQVFEHRYSIQACSDPVPDEDVALPPGPIKGRIDAFGNFDIHNAFASVGQHLVVAVSGARNLIFPVRNSLFDAQAAKTIEEAMRPECHGFSEQASGGGWRVRVFDRSGRVQKTALQTSQAYVRTENHDVPSFAAIAELQRNGNGEFLVPEAVRLEVVGAVLDRRPAPELATSAPV